MNRDPVGLCRACRFARVVENRRGSVFYLCGRAETEAEFPRYPRLPVLRCRGFAAGTGESASGDPDR